MSDRPNVVDSCGWLEYFANGPNADFFAPAIEAIDKLVVPSITVLEVFKVVLRQRNEDAALQAVAAMRSGRVVDLDFELSLSAARVGIEENLPLADSVVLATAQAHGAEVWTQDADFEGLTDVRYVTKR